MSHAEPRASGLRQGAAGLGSSASSGGPGHSISHARLPLPSWCHGSSRAGGAHPLPAGSVGCRDVAPQGVAPGSLTQLSPCSPRRNEVWVFVVFFFLQTRVFVPGTEVPGSWLLAFAGWVVSCVPGCGAEMQTRSMCPDWRAASLCATQPRLLCPPCKKLLGWGSRPAICSSSCTDHGQVSAWHGRRGVLGAPAALCR